MLKQVWEFSLCLIQMVEDQFMQSFQTQKCCILFKYVWQRSANYYAWAKSSLPSAFVKLYWNTAAFAIEK